MLNKKISLLLGYICGAVVTSLYNKKKPSDLKRSLNKNEAFSKGNFKVLFDTFIETHKNFLSDVESSLISEQNKEKFETKKQDILDFVDDYKDEAYNMVAHLKTKGKEFFSQAVDKIEELYHETLSSVECHTDATSKKGEECKKKLFASFEEIKGEIKKELKKETK